MEPTILYGILAAIIVHWVFMLFRVKHAILAKHYVIDVVITERILLYESIFFFVVQKDFPLLEEVWLKGKDYKEAGMELNYSSEM